MNLSQLTQFVSNLSQQFQQALNLAKRIDELPVQESINGNSKIHVSHNGVSQSLLLQKIIDAASSLDYNRIISIGTIQREGTQFTVPAGATWKISGVEGTNISPFEFELLPEAPGSKRIDVLIVRLSGFEVITGTPSSDISFAPDIPNPSNAILVKEYKIDGDAIDEAPAPISGNPYILKNQFNQIAAAADKKFYLQQKSNYLIIDEGITEIKGIYLNENGEAESYTGKIGFFTNFLNVPVPMRHMDADPPVKFKFPKTNYDYLIQPGETLYFIEESYNVADSNLWKCLNEKTSTVSPASLLSGNANNAAVLGSDEKIFVPGPNYSQQQTVSGLFTFLNGMFGMRNVANTFTSFFRNTNTAARTYTLQNRDGTLLDNTDLSAINSAISGKMNAATGAENFLTKWTTAGSIGISRLFDNGTFFGIGTVVSPSKDLTFGNQQNRTIGIENSSSTVRGRDLEIKAGNTINYQLASTFLPTNKTAGAWSYLKASKANNDIYAVTSSTINGILAIWRSTGGNNVYSSISGNDWAWSGLAVDDVHNNIYSAGPYNDIWVQINKTGNFVGLNQTPARSWGAMFCQSNGNVYVVAPGYGVMVRNGGAGQFVLDSSITPRGYADFDQSFNNDVFAVVPGGDIYKRTNGIGDFVALGQTARAWSSIAVTQNGNVYASVLNGDIYVMTSGTSVFLPTGQTARAWKSLTSKGNTVFAGVANGDIYQLNTDSTGTENLDGGNLKLKSGTGKGTGGSKVQIVTGQKTASGTDMQVETVRAEFDENGHFQVFLMPTFANNAEALAAGLDVGKFYKTASGDLKIVY